MNDTIVRPLYLKSLQNGIPVIPVEAAGFYQQSCMVCFDNQNHKSGVKLKVQHHDDSTVVFQVFWDGEVTEELRRAYADLVRTTENGACAIALLIVREITKFTAIEQAVRGTTIDYYLSYKEGQDNLLFNYAARLEATGILREDGTNTIDNRLKEKLNRLKPGLPTLIIVVEFSYPKSKVIKHEYSS
jgi:hypothetical protein